jgi:hypothetical protein
MRTNLDRQNCDPHGLPANRNEDQPIAVEERQILHRLARKPGEILTSSRPQRLGTHCSVQTPSGGMNGIGGVIRNHLRNTSPVSGNAALATRLSTIPRGIAPSFILVLTLSMARASSDKEGIHISSRVSSLLPYGGT